MLRIKGLTKRYRTGDLALKGIDLDVPDGEVMALIGPSGAGKSTVIRCINRLVEPTAGTVTLNDIEITTLGGAGLRRARRRMGMIFQEYALVERLTVMENVLSGRLGYVGFWQSWLRKFPQADVDEAFRLRSLCSQPSCGGRASSCKRSASAVTRTSFLGSSRAACSNAPASAAR